MPPQPTALPPCTPTDLLNYTLTHYTYPTTLLICSTRAVFLSSLDTCIANESNTSNSPVQQPPAAPAPPPDADRAPEHTEQPPHPLLTPTLHQISTSRHITTVFVRTVAHLRAYLAVFTCQDDVSPPPPPSLSTRFDKPGAGAPLLIAYGLVALHRNSSDWSAQGLSNSAAALVEAGWRAGREVVLVEPLAPADEGGDAVGSAGGAVGGEQWQDKAASAALEFRMQEIDGSRERDEEVHPAHHGRRRQQEGVWRQRLPLLSGSSRRAGPSADDDSKSWTGRTVEVRSVLARWFRFANVDYWEQHETHI